MHALIQQTVDPDKMQCLVAFDVGLHLFQSTCIQCNNFSIQYSSKLSGRVLDLRPRGRGLEPHRRHCVVVLEQDTFILA